MFCNNCGTTVKCCGLKDIATVKNCLGLLSKEERIVVLAYYYDGLNVDEIAEVFEISSETVNSRLYLARKHLMSMLEDAEEMQGHKFFTTEIAMLMLALDDMMNSNIEIAESDLTAKYAETCSGII